MQVACLPYGCDAAHLRRVLASLPNLSVLCLPATVGDQWLLATLKLLGRELFLKPELQVVAAVETHAVDNVLSVTAQQLCDSRLDTLPMARVSATAQPTAIVEWLAAGETLQHTRTGAELDEDALLVAAHVQLGAAPLVEANDSGARVIVASGAAPGVLTLSATYASLDLDAHDWDRLASLQTMARLAEQVPAETPLGIDVQAGAAAYLASDPSLQPADIDSWLQSLRQNNSHGASSADVSVDLSNASIESVTPGRFILNGIVGKPPSGRCEVSIAYRHGDRDAIRYWPTTVAKALVDWDVKVRAANRWLWN